MEKEFEALSRTKSEIIDGFPTGNLWVGMTPEELETIKQALNELKAIKEANPNEALEGLKHIKKYYVPEPCTATTYNYLEIIEQALLNAQEMEKVLNTIREKKVNVGNFYFMVLIMGKDYDFCKLNNNNAMYNICDTRKDFLTKEEFDLLKRWLEND